MTEDIKEKLELVESANLQELYGKVHSQIYEHCMWPMHKMGYPTAADISGGSGTLKSYNEWWKVKSANANLAGE